MSSGADPEKTLVSVSFEIFGVAKHVPEGSVQKSWGSGGALNPLVGYRGRSPLEALDFIVSEGPELAYLVTSQLLSG